MPLVSWKVVRGEPQIQPEKSLANEGEPVLYYLMNKSVVSSEKSLKLFHLEINYLLKKFVDLQGYMLFKT